MKFFLGLFGAIVAQECAELTDDLTLDFVQVARKCGTEESENCGITCRKGFDLQVRDDSQDLSATCACTDPETCNWTYGIHGLGEQNEIPDFACCNGPFKKQQKAKSAKRVKMTGKPYIEADATSALVLYKIKSGKQAISEGYSILVTFESVLPDDIVISPFSRMEISNIHSTDSKTYVMFKSQSGHDDLNKRETFYLSFTVTSDGTTNVADFLESTDANINLYRGRHNCYCPGNDEFCQSSEPTKFASFNIQVFGASKYGKEEVKDQIVTILRRYDISTIQEIRESSGVSFPLLVGDMNAQEDIYDFHVGERQGRSSSKEQIGFIWNRNMFSKVDAYDYDDTSDDFERPPSVLVLERIGDNAFSFETSKLIIISSHIKPVTGASDTVTEDEINNLMDVYNDAVSKHPEISNAIIAGDFNADCDYVQDPEGLSLFTDPSSGFLIGFDADTTVGATDCAYDHIVVFGDTLPGSSGDAGVFNYQTFYDTDNIFHDGEPITALISDHFPVEFTFS